MAARHRLGMELGSHTVAHSTVFSHFRLGTGTERYPEYQPYVKTKTKAANGSVFGELRVSKYLIEKLSGGTNVMSFRPGELSNPKALPQALVATGYRYSSSSTEREFVAAVRDVAWFGSIGQDGTWWAARNRVEVDVQTRGTQKILSVPVSEQLAGLTVQIPRTWRLAMQQTHAPIEATGGNFVVLGAMQGTVRLVFDVLP